jgi:hypothetical protein
MGDDLDLVSSETPAHAAPERLLETGERVHDDRVDVLMVEGRILRKLVRIHRGEWIEGGAALVFRVAARGADRVRGRVEVDHLHAVAPGTVSEVLGLEGHRRRQDLAAPIPDFGILRDDGEAVKPTGSWSHRRAHGAPGPHGKGKAPV